MTSDQFKLAKWLTGLLVSGSVSKVVSDVIQNNTNNNHVWDAFQIKIATWTLGGIAADRIWKMSDDKVDQFGRWATRAKKIAEEEKEKEEKEKNEEDVIIGEIVEDNGGKA